jgi:hypothetical protein
MFSVAADESTVVAESARRLQFEAKDAMAAFRSDIRSALSRLQIDSSSHLRVVYTPASDPAHGWVDLENVTLYNVGMGHFAHLLNHGISCERLHPAGTTHRIEYRGERDWAQRDGENQLVARVHGTLSEFPQSVSAWWRALRLMDTHVTKRLGEQETYGLELVVTIPRPEGWLGPRLKPLLDGLISALHAHDGSGRDLLEPRLDQLLGTRNWDLLTDDAQSALPRRRLLRPHGSTFAWNPADDLCTRFDVRVERGAPAISAAIVSG